VSAWASRRFVDPTALRVRAEVPTRVGEDSGQVIAYVDGQRNQCDPRSISLGAHAVIRLDVGTDGPPAPYTFAPDL
jgi:hypothetical protein